MKKFILFAVSCFVITTAYNQQVANNPFPKTITVTGSAEMEIIPDQIFVNVVLREYQKKNDTKKDLEMLKTSFLTSCQQSGIPDSVISIVSYTGYNNYYWLRKDKKKTPDLFASITYQIKFSSSKQMDELIVKLDDEATQSFDIVNTSHSKMSEYRKQLKIGAVKAAKEKAIYLTEAINEKLGSAITVKEPDETSNLIVRGTNGIYSQSVLSNSIAVYGGDKSVEVDFKKIKLRYEVNVIFALQ